MRVHRVSPLAVALALAVARALVLTVAFASAVHFPHSTDGFDKCGVVHEPLMLHLGWRCSERAVFLMMATRRARAPCVPVIGPCTASCVIWFGFVCIHMGFCECFPCFCTLCIFNVFNRFYKGRTGTALRRSWGARKPFLAPLKLSWDGLGCS